MKASAGLTELAAEALESTKEEEQLESLRALSSFLDRGSMTLVVTADGGEFFRYGGDSGPDETLMEAIALLGNEGTVTAGSLNLHAHTVVSGGILLNTDTHRVYVEGREVELKNKEYALLRFLMLHADTVFSREQLYEHIWGMDALGDNATVVVHINRLREKIEADPSAPRHIQTVWGVGYRFKA